MAATASPTSDPSKGLFLPEGASLPTRLRLAVRALRILEKDPGDAVAAPLLNACLDGGVYTALCAELLRTEDGRQLLAQRPELQGSDLRLDELSRLPPQTLGHQLARYYVENKISPFESPYEVRNDVDYLAKRYRETHDIAHVLTGYRTDVLGEMELQAFMLGNLGIRTALLILAYSVATWSLGGPPGLFVRRIRAAYQRGVRSKQLLRLRYEHHWQTPVEELRQLAGIAG